MADRHHSLSQVREELHEKHHAGESAESDAKHAPDEHHSPGHAHSPGEHHESAESADKHSPKHANSPEKHPEVANPGDASGMPSHEEAHEGFFEGYLLQRLGVNFHYWFFPGLIMHELSHYLVAVLSGSRVAEVVFWSPRGGHVMHTRVRGSSSVLIAIAPIIVNNLLALWLLQDGFNALRADGIGATEWLWGAVAVWVGFSFAIYSFPSKPDLCISRMALKRSYWGKVEAGGLLTRIAAILVYPVLFLLQAIFILFVIPFSTNRTLRLLWGIALAVFFLSGVPGEQLF